MASQPHTAAAAALFTSQTERTFSHRPYRLSLQLQTDLRPTNRTSPWSAV